LDKKPTLFEDLQPVWLAFNNLNMQRRVGYAPNRISILEVVAWLDMYEIDDPEERRWYWKMITVLDDVWMKKAQKEIKAKTRTK